MALSPLFITDRMELRNYTQSEQVDPAVDLGLIPPPPGKDAIDRMSGAGAWARDPDSLLVMTPHEEPDCFTVTPILRNLPRAPEFVVQWDFPLMRLTTDLDPASLRRPQSKNKVCSDKEFIDAVITTKPLGFSEIVKQAAATLAMSRSTAARCLTRLTEASLISTGNGLYWRREGERPREPKSS